MSTVLDAPPVAPLWEHQTEAIDAALQHNGFMLPIPMGGGKSRCATEIADRTGAMRVLVLCPKSVCGVWPKQLDEHSERPWRVWAGHVNGARGPIKNPSVERRAAALLDANTAAIRLRAPFLAIVNFEAAPAGNMGNLLLGTDWDLVIIDESHRIKAPGGRQSKFIARICRRTRSRGGRVLALTGTPMPHSPLDLYGQFRAIDETLLGTSYVQFRAKYGQPRIKFLYNDGTPCYLTGPGGQPIYDGVREDRVDELMSIVGARMYQIDADELDRKLGLIEPRDVYRDTELQPVARRAYDALQKDLIARVDNLDLTDSDRDALGIRGDSGGTVVAANAMVLVTRLAQAASGYAVDATTGARIPLSKKPEKAALLAEILEDLPPHEPVVVFARFHHDLDWIRIVTEAAGRTYGELSGRRRDGLTDDSTMNPAIDVLGAQLKSGGVGIDLTRSKYAVYYSMDFSLADHQQSRKRLHRPGQDGQVTYIHLICRDTIDEAIYGALKKRREIVASVLARLNERNTP